MSAFRALIKEDNVVCTAQLVFFLILPLSLPLLDCYALCNMGNVFVILLICFASTSIAQVSAADFVPWYKNATEKQPNCTKSEEIWKNLLDEGWYQKQVPPKPEGVVVKVELFVQDIRSVNVLASEVEMDAMILELWTDERLKYDYINPCKTNITGGEDILSKIWTPTTGITNAKQMTIHDFPFKMITVTLFPDGAVWTSIK